MKTYHAKPSDISKKWHLIDAEGKTLGRLATAISTLLMGKHKAIFTPSVDTGDFVIVVNAEKVRLSGRKADSKVYRRHSGYPGGLTTVTYGEQVEKYPDRVLRAAVWGMLPKNSLGRARLKKLKIYAGSEHPHEAQAPEPFEIS